MSLGNYRYNTSRFWLIMILAFSIMLGLAYLAG